MNSPVGQSANERGAGIFRRLSLSASQFQRVSFPMVAEKQRYLPFADHVAKLLSNRQCDPGLILLTACHTIE